MAKKYLDDNGLLYLWGKIKEKFALKTHTHTKSEITDFPTTMPPTSHTHGNITNTGTLQTTDVAIANGDKLVITDSSNSSKVARASLSFDASTESKVLSKKGTWVDLPSGVSPSDSDPLMDGTASAGSSGLLARGDHRHPVPYGTCPTAVTNATKTVTCSGFTLEAGSWAAVKFTATVSGTIPATAITLDINSTGAKSVKHPILGLVSGQKFACGGGATHLFVYDGTDYWLVGGYFTAATTTANGLMTSTDKTKLDGIDAGAEVNVLEGVQMAGTDLTITDKKVNVPAWSNTQTGVLEAPNTASQDAGRTVLTSNGFKTIGYSFSQTNDGSLTSKLKFGSLSSDMSISVTVPAATTTKNGAMSGADKAKLDSISMTNGIIDSSCLPSFVDDVIEAYARPNQTELGSTWLATESASGTVITPEAGKIYVLMNSSTNYEQNTQFRWGGTAYVQLNDSGCTAITNAEIDTIVAS